MLKTLNVFRFLLFLSLSSLLAACGAFQRGPESTDGWLVDLPPIVPGSAYQVSRAQHYPLASDAPLFVVGSDERIASNFGSALASHFQQVETAEKAELAFTSGFMLELDGDTKAKRLVIRITDLSTKKTFDRVRIDFSSPAPLANSSGASIDDRGKEGNTRPIDRRVRSALIDAAASIAGHS